MPALGRMDMGPCSFEVFYSDEPVSCGVVECGDSTGMRAVMSTRTWLETMLWNHKGSRHCDVPVTGKKSLAPVIVHA